MATGHPALVVTTSGTAAAELHAAVVEADLARVPAHRLHRRPAARAAGRGRPPDHRPDPPVRALAPVVLPTPACPTTAARWSWRSLAARTVAEATSGVAGPGPVHLNLPFREPLLGDPAAGSGCPRAGPAGGPWHRVVAAVAQPGPGCVSALVDDRVVHPARRGLIVAGAGCGDRAAVLALSDALGWPVLADPRSGLRGLEPGVVAAADGILRSDRFVADHLPDAVLRLGEPWVSKVVDRFLSAAVDDGARAVAVDPWGRWADPERAGARSWCGPTRRGSARSWSTTLGGSGANGTGSDRGRRWIGSWCAAEEAAQGVIGPRWVQSADRRPPDR